MCLRILSEGAEAAELVCHHLGASVRKSEASDEFDRWRIRLSLALERAATPIEREAIEAVGTLFDVDWRSLSRSRRAEILGEAGLEVSSLLMAVAPATHSVTRERVASVATETRLRVSEGLPRRIPRALTALDDRVVRHVGLVQTHALRLRATEVGSSLGEDAARVLLQGMEEGLPSREIASQLRAVAEHRIAGPVHRWDVLASDAVGRTRSLVQLSSYRDAVLDRYRWVSVQDERTTEICQFLDGQVFSVGLALSRFEQMEASPGSIRELQPWLRRRGAEVHARVGTRSHVVARLEGNRPQPVMAAAELQSLGIGSPPAHALCRATTVAVF